jgi:excisionase family DNA binding protein
VLTPRKKFLTSYQLSEWLGVAPRTVTEWAEQWFDSGGQQGIPAFKIGRSWRFDADRVQAWINEKQMPPAGVPLPNAATAASAESGAEKSDVLMTF